MVDILTQANTKFIEEKEKEEQNYCNLGKVGFLLKKMPNTKKKDSRNKSCKWRVSMETQKNNKHLRKCKSNNLKLLENRVGKRKGGTNP